MALIICSECGKEFSDKAPACPNCGCPTSLQKLESETNCNKDTGKLEENAECTNTVNREIELKIDSVTSLIYDDKKLKIKYASKILADDAFENFILTWHDEISEYDEKIERFVFKHPSCNQPISIKINKMDTLYKDVEDFFLNVVDKYFKEELEYSYYSANQDSLCSVINNVSVSEDHKEDVKLSIPNVKYAKTIGDIIIMIACTGLFVWFTSGFSLIGSVIPFFKFISPAIIGIIYLISRSMYNNSLALQASEMKCPKCGGTNINVSLIASSSTTRAYAVTNNIAVADTEHHHSKMAVCQNCAYSWNYLRIEDIALSVSKNLMWKNYWRNLFFICLILSFFIN